MADTIVEFLSQQEALSFVKTKLGIEDAEKLFEHDRISLINRTIRSWFERIPFQNLSQLLRGEQKEAPTVQQATNDIIDGVGGLCGTHAIGAYHILSAIGFDCYTVIGEVDQLGLNHAIVVVKDLNKASDLHLVELGCGYPTFEAVPLQLSGNLVDSTEQITQSFVTYKYVRNGNTFSRYHKTSLDSKSDKQGRPYPKYLDGFWGQFYSFSIDPVPISEIRKQLNRNVYLNPEHKFNRMFLACKYPNGAYVDIMGKKIISEINDYDVDGKCLKFTYYESKEDLGSVCNQYFTEIKSSFLDEAWKTWQKLPENIRI